MLCDDEGQYCEFRSTKRLILYLKGDLWSDKKTDMLNIYNGDFSGKCLTVASR